MSSKIVEKKYHFVPGYESVEEESINLKNIIIPFSKVGTSKKYSDFYNGAEDIPFKERHPIFKKILLNEFIE